MPRLIVGQGPTALAGDAVGVVWTFFLSATFPLCERRPEILSQRAVKPKSINQSINLPFRICQMASYEPRGGS